MRETRTSGSMSGDAQRCDFRATALILDSTHGFGRVGLSPVMKVFSWSYARREHDKYSWKVRIVY